MAHTTLVSVAALAEHLDDREWIVFDCRFSLADNNAGGKAYRQGHIPGARYVHLNHELSTPVKPYTGRHPLPDFSVLAERMGSWGVSNRSQVVVYDDAGGAFAGRMWWLLRCMGHQQVAVLDGGIGHWRRQGLPLTTRLPKYYASRFRIYPDSRQWLGAREVEDGLATGGVTLIDARTAERFLGRQEPIDPVAGHVPKALNRPFQLNLDKNGLFLSAKLLERQFKQLTVGVPAQQVVHMCGSGVTACHNLLAMEFAGLQGSRLYAGSWSEWIVNPNRAIAIG
ncbi:MAG: sulfurtransferase [Methylococcales bacterium]|nr:sulfurtransferase [Methylococcales bacterium]